MPIKPQLLRQISLRQLQVFKTVVDCGGHTKAARKLHLTQPTISMQLKKLEETIGHPLIEQIGRKLHTTPVGQKLYETTQDVLTRLHQLEEEVASAGEIAGPLRLTVVTGAKYFMPHLLGDFLRQYPRVRPSMAVTNREQVIEHLLGNHADLAIMGKVPESLPLYGHNVLDNELVFVARADHPLTRERNIPLQRLVTEPFLTRERGSGTLRAVRRKFKEEGVEIEPWLELGSSEATKQGLLAGLGISVLSRHNLRLELETGRLVTLDVQGFPLHRTWYAVHHQGKHLSLAAQTFVEFLCDNARRLLTQTAPAVSQKPAAE